MSGVGLLLVTCLAGGVGAAARWWCDRYVQEAVGGRYPWGTIVVNVSGSFLLGALVALAGETGSGLVQALGFGLLGGYTTFSSSVLQSVRAASAEGPVHGVLHALTTVMLCLFAALCGLQVG